MFDDLNKYKISNIRPNQPLNGHLLDGHAGTHYLLAYATDDNFFVCSLVVDGKGEQSIIVIREAQLY